MRDRVDCAGKMVTCFGCGETYVCTPARDYYNNTTFSDGVCESCLLAGRRGANPPTWKDGEARMEELAAEGVVVAITDDFGDRHYFLRGGMSPDG